MPKNTGHDSILDIQHQAAFDADLSGPIPLRILVLKELSDR
jgi:hypothetical protein